ncbi:MAG: hypothetical protein PVG07_11940 [Acidobacteriota bacterium]
MTRADRSILWAALALGLLSTWLLLLFTGLLAGGAVHLLLIAALVAFPWRALREEDP